jgi:anti-sigma regulatory factor (Ser/Thr protein kinase)
MEGAVATGPLETALPAEARSVTEARQAICGYLGSLDAPDTAAVALAVTEIVGNAVVHAFRDRPPGTIELRASVLVPDTLVVSVSDDGDGMSPRTDSPGLGFGLPLVGEVCSGFAVERNEPHGTRVVMRFALTPGHLN